MLSRRLFLALAFLAVSLPAFAQERVYEYIAWLTPHEEWSVYDGDTVRLTVDLGFGIMLDLGPCRLFGINAPEIRPLRTRAEATRARDYLEDRLEQLGRFTIRTHKDHEKGKYGRYLVEIFDADGNSLNEALVAAGHAVRAEY